MAANRIRELRDALDLSQAELAALVRPKTSQAQIDRLEKGLRQLTQRWMMRLAPALQVEPAELIAEKGSTFLWPKPVRRIAPGGKKGDTKTVTIDEMDVAAGAGPEGTVSWDLLADQGNLLDAVNRRLSWSVPADLTRQVTYSPPEHIKIISVVGNSMAPDFMPGQKLMVDTVDRTPSPPGIFVVWDGMALVAKIVEYIPFSEPPTVRLWSRNPDYRPYERTVGEAYIQGRVIGRWQWT